MRRFCVITIEIHVIKRYRDRIFISFEIQNLEENKCIAEKLIYIYYIYKMLLHTHTYMYIYGEMVDLVNPTRCEKNKWKST